MQREERVTVQGPVKEQQPDGISHGGGGWVPALFGKWGPPSAGPPPPPWALGVGRCCVGGWVVGPIFAAPKAPNIFFFVFSLLLISWWVSACLLPPYEGFTSLYDVDCPVHGWLVTALLPPPPFPPREEGSPCTKQRPGRDPCRAPVSTENPKTASNGILGTSAST